MRVATPSSHALDKAASVIVHRYRGVQEKDAAKASGGMRLQSDSQNNLFATDHKWTDKPSVPDQEAVYPDTVRMVDIVTEVFDLGEVEGRKRYSDFFQSVLQLTRLPIKEISQAPDAGKMNFRVLVVHGRREYMNIQPR